MTANPPQPTISQPFSHAKIPFLAWAHGVGLDAQAEALIEVLAVRTARTDLLSAVLHRLARASTLLSSWAEEGADLYGLAQLARGLRDDAGALAALPGRSEPPLHDILRAFPGQAESHYLYACMTVRDPVPVAARPWFNTLRIWLLAKNLARADQASSDPSLRKRGVSHVRDTLIQEAASRLRMASEERDQTLWLAALLRIDGPHGWFELRRHLESLPSHAPRAGAHLAETERDLYKCLSRIARDEALPARTGDGDGLITHSFSRARDAPTLLLPPAANADAEERFPAHDLLLRDDEEEDDEIGLQLVEVDESQSPAAQELHGRTLQLLSGADARYLAWDWYGLTPPEASALRRLMEAALTKGGDSLVASMTWIAWKSARSLGMAERIRLASVSSDASDDWALDIDAGRLFRRPPRRAGHWSPAAELAPRLGKPARALEISLDPRVQGELERARAHSLAPQLLRDLWPVADGQDLRSAFRAWVAAEPALRRVTQGMLSQSRGREVFEATHDHVLARLLASQPASGLPAATAYSAYRFDQLPGSLSCTVREGGPANVAGSLLDPLAGFLKDGFAGVMGQIARLAQGRSAIEYHNAVTHYWDAVLRAATGIRPFAQRWIDAGAVDETLEFVVVDDKPGLFGPRTRLVPLPPGLWERFRHSYLAGHLEALSRWLAAQGMSGVDRLGSRGSGGSTNAPQALLFLLRVQGDTLIQVPVGLAPAAAELSPEAPLPRRTYRHWLRTQLHRASADAEIVDSMFGHQDGATSTHGDYSMRVWRDDAERMKPYLGRIFDSLETSDPPPVSFAGFDTLPVSRFDSAALAPESPGLVARTRWLIHMKAARSAARLLTALLQGNDAPVSGERLGLKELTRRLGAMPLAEEVERLGAALMSAPRGAPATLGPVRYAFFLRLIERTWEASGRRPPMRRRLALRPRDDSPFRRSAAGALGRRAQAMSMLKDATTDLVPSKLTLAEAGWLAVLDLALSSRCSDRDLHRVLQLRQDIRVCRLGDAHYLEWSPTGSARETDSPIQRLRITSLAAHAVLLWMSSSQDRLSPRARVPRRLESLAAFLCGQREVEFEIVRDALVDLTEQCNGIELPGTLAAYLAGRVRSASLHWGDWLALQTGQRRDVRQLHLVFHHPTHRKDAGRAALVTLEKRPEPAPPNRLMASTARPHSRVGGALSALDCQRQARTFFRRVRALLQTERDATGTPGRRVSEDSYRRDTRRAIEKLASETSGTVSTAVVALALWCASLLDREVTRELLRMSTVLRYLTALSARFEAAAAETDLLSLDAEEIEDLYATLIGLRDRSGRSYPAARLRDFHRFGERELGLPAIDWSEIVPEQEHQLCAPGYVDESTFGLLLASLARAPELEARERLATQALAILAYRAGLRCSEALGLRLDDLYLDDSPPWLAVDKNRLRGLKSFSARRTVPMPHLRGFERRILRRLLRDAKWIARGHAGSRALFAHRLEPDSLVDVEFVRRTLNASLKAASAQDHISMHHLRHSFGTRLACELEPSTPEGIGPARWQRTAPAAREILGLSAESDSPTRRSIWALSRVLGHAHPRTTYFSYVHVLGDLASHSAFAEVARGWRPPPRERVLDLDTLPAATPAVHTRRPPAAPLEAEHVLAMVCDLDCGTPADRLPARYPIRRERARQFADLLREIEVRLLGAERDDVEGESATRGPSRKMPLARGGLMSHILESRLPELRRVVRVLYSGPCRDEIRSHEITLAEFVSMFGSKRNVSMWRVAQFRLVDCVIRHLGIADERIRLVSSTDLNPTVAERAMKAGWLRRNADGSLTPARPAMQWITDQPLDVVRFQDESVRHRVMLSLVRDSNAGVSTRWEFALVLLAAAELLSFQPEGE